MSYYRFPLKICLISLITLLSTASYAMPVPGLKVTNIDIIRGTFTPLVVQKIVNPERHCRNYPNTEVIAQVDRFEYNQTFQMPSADAELVCVVATAFVQTKYYSSALKNTAACEIQIYRTQREWSDDWARASEECGYTGYCIDGKDYTYGNRHLSEKGTEEYDTFEKVCLPYIPDHEL